ncbi:acyltransferase [Nocardioides sp. LHD-245]|uniref:acyltransferase n=1 Tax=Nocardioides sp. LHD-245 TaxID=3051387 RepID=UPI0027E095B1|nr:acyltransferase [Nocardioides sp. LHD-245]
MLDLRRPLRRLLNRSVHAAWRWAEHQGDVAPGTALADGFGAFGPGACLAFPLSAVVNASAIHVGRDTLIGKYATLSVGYGPTQVVLPARGLVIGERCVLGARVCITAHESIEIGDDVWFGQDVFVSDASHGYEDPDVPIGRQFGAHRPVRIGSGSWIGHGAMVLPGTTIGRNVVVAAGSVVRGDVPDHAVVGGVPARLIRRLDAGGRWARASGAASG